MTYGHAQHKIPCPRGHEVYKYGRPIVGHHYYILSLSDVCLSVENRDNFCGLSREIMHFNYMTYMAMPYQKNPCVPKGS